MSLPCTEDSRVLHMPSTSSDALDYSSLPKHKISAHLSLASCKFAASSPYTFVPLFFLFSSLPLLFDIKYLLISIYFFLLSLFFVATISPSQLICILSHSSSSLLKLAYIKRSVSKSVYQISKTNHPYKLVLYLCSITCKELDMRRGRRMEIGS